MTEWIEWNGGEIPVAKGTFVEVIHRDCGIHKGFAGLVGHAHDWTHTDDAGDILAYRILPTSRFENIRAWAHDRNLIEGGSKHAQMLKGMEEFGEVAAAVARNDLEGVKDGIGDVVVVLTILAAQHGVRIEECLEHAWNEIKDRKGRMVDGIFIKEADLT